MSDTIRTLKEIFENNNIDLCKNMLITNYDKKIVGTFHAGVYKEAIQRFNKDFMVSSFDDDGQLISITIEEINPDTVDNFKYEVKTIDFSHSKDFGDGKYWNE